MKKLIIILGVVGTSLSVPFVRFSNAPSMVLVLYRMAFATVILLPYILIKNRDEIKFLHIKEIILCLISGIFLGFHFSCYFESLNYTSIASAVVLVDTEVFFVAFISLLLFKEKISKIGWFGIVITFAGSVIIALADSGSGSNVLLGDALAFSGAAFMAVYTIIGKIVRKNMTTTTYTFIVYFMAGITVLIVLLISGKPIFGYDRINFLTALGMAVCCTLLGHSIFSWGLKYESASFVSTVILLEPVFATITGIFLFGETPSLTVVIGGIIVIAGIYTYSNYAEKYFKQK